jgi:hypothetical protein
MNLAQPNGRLRSILTIPLITPNNPINGSSRPFINPTISDNSLIAMDEFLEMHEDRWQQGVLDPLTENNVPAENFTQALLSEVPTQLHDLISENRFHYRFQNGGVLIGLSQITTTGLEFWCSASTTSPSFLIIHLECNYGPSNKQALESFSNLNGKSLTNFLNNFFLNLNDPSKDVSSLVVRNSRKGLLILNFKNSLSSVEVENGCLIIKSEDMDTFEPRFKSRFSLLSMVIGMQRFWVDSFKSNWPVLDNLNKNEALKLRSQINKFSNKWVWPRISTDDSYNSAYKQWQSSFSVTEYLKNFKDELDEHLEIKILQGSERIEIILMSVAVLGIIPTWLGLFNNLSERLAVGSAAISVFLVFIFWYRKRNQ